MKSVTFLNVFVVFGVFLFLACSEEPPTIDDDGEGDSFGISTESHDVDVAETDEEGIDSDAGEEPRDESCTHLFGNPTDLTGLPDEMCKPFFNCAGVAFHPPVYSADDIEWLESRVHLNPLEELAENPYDHPEKYSIVKDKFCGVIFENDEKSTYRLETFDSREELEQDGAQLTHSGACGHCSSLQSLAVYIENEELTGPVKSCGAKGILAGQERTIQCLMKIGFDRRCATVWYYNTKNTRSECLLKCLDDFFATKYHNEDGSLNDCIQCDEDRSGPVFKATSGRTRRNSGLPSALCRPCESVTPVVHWYR